MTAAAPPIMQHPDEFEALLNLYRQRQPKRTLEIGTGFGGTLWHWVNEAPAGAVIVSVDRHQLTDRGYGISGREITVVCIRGDSHDPVTVRAVDGWGPYDWVFVDADHHDEAVRADWRLYRPFVAAGGVVAFHDIAPSDDPTVEVEQLWAELAAAHETIEFVEAGGYGIGVVLNPHLESVF